MIHGNSHQFAKTLALVSMTAMGLITSTAIPALAAAGSFNTTRSMSTARVFHTATLIANGQALVTGGDSTVGGGTLASAELYNPATGNWIITGSMTVCTCRA